MDGALKKVEGDTALLKDPMSCFLGSKCQDILENLSVFTEGQKFQAGKVVHPLDLIMASYKDIDTAAATVQKCRVFLEDSFKVNTQRFETATMPDAWYY